MEFNTQVVLAMMTITVSVTWFFFNHIFKVPIDNLTLEVKNLSVALSHISERITRVEVKLSYLECSRDQEDKPS